METEDRATDTSVALRSVTMRDQLSIDGIPVVCACVKCRQKAAKKRERRDLVYMAVGCVVGVVFMWFYCQSFA